MSNFPLGDGSTKAGKYNMRLVRRAIINGWNVPAEIKELVVSQMALIVGSADKPRDKIGAGKVLAAIDANDARLQVAYDTDDLAQQVREMAEQVKEMQEQEVMNHESRSLASAGRRITAGNGQSPARPDAVRRSERSGDDLDEGGDDAGPLAGDVAPLY